MSHDFEADHHGGLSRDLQALSARLNRRRLLEWAAYLGVSAVACSGDNDGGPGDGSSQQEGTGNLASDGSCINVPDETAGPFPGDGTNGQNALTLTGIVRSDIRSSVGGATGVAGGIALTLRLRLMSTACGSLPGLAVYVWQCDREGRYSMYSPGAENENYLRGVQVADDAGVVSFTTVFPACYPGRWPHIHFEIYESLAAATTGNNALKTSQLALPESACNAVFASSGYEASVTSLSRISLTSDGVFRDGANLQLTSISGDVDSGYIAMLDVALPL